MAKNLNKYKTLQLNFEGILKYISRIFVRIFFLPFYATLIIPWIIIIEQAQNSAINEAAFRIVAILSRNPSATSLDEGNLAVAVITIFLIGNIIYETIIYFRNPHSSKQSKKKWLKIRLLTQTFLSIFGWTTLAYFERDNDLNLLMIFIGIGFVMVFVFWLEYIYKIALTNKSPDKKT